ncbi:MAG: DUF5686 family protein [bacterium]
MRIHFLIFLLVSFAGSGFCQIEDLSADEIIERARRYLTEGNYFMEDYSCSTRTSTFVVEELLDIYQRYDIEKFAFTPVDDWATGVIYWKKPDKFVYDVDEYFRSQTWGDTIFAPVKAMSATVNGPFVFDSLKVVSPLCDSCFAYYDFDLLSVVTVDEYKKCYEIGIHPKKKDRALVSGTIRIEDQHFSVVDMKISFSRKSKSWFPMRSECDIRFFLWEERYNLCYQMVIKHELVIPKMVKLNILQKVDFWDFTINTGIPDAFFGKKTIDIRDAKSYLSDKPFSLASFSQQMQGQASERYKYSGRFAVWTGVWDAFTLNRVEGLQTTVGFKTEGAFSKYWRTGLKLWYGWSNQKLGYQVDFGHYIPYGKGLSYGAAVYDGIYPVDPKVISRFSNSLGFLFSKNDHFDYFHKKGVSFFSQYLLNDNWRFGVKASNERNASVGVINTKYRPNPEIEEGRFTTFDLYSLWDSKPVYLPTSRWSLSNQILFSIDRLNSNRRGFVRFYSWLRRYQVLPLRLAFEADMSAGLSRGHLPLQHRFTSIHDRYRFDKDEDYTNWYGEGAVACGVSFFFGEQLFEKFFLATRLRFLTVYRLRFMVFADLIRFYDTLPDAMNKDTFLKGKWETDKGFGLEGLNGLLRIEFSNRYIGLRIRPDFIPDLFK